jgi:hypothetical protein
MGSGYPPIVTPLYRRVFHSRDALTMAVSYLHAKSDSAGKPICNRHAAPRRPATQAMRWASIVAKIGSVAGCCVIGISVHERTIIGPRSGRGVHRRDRNLRTTTTCRLDWPRPAPGLLRPDPRRAHLLVVCLFCTREPSFSHLAPCGLFVSARGVRHAIAFGGMVPKFRWIHCGTSSKDPQGASSR